jgi:hypothetical protein
LREACSMAADAQSQDRSRMDRSGKLIQQPTRRPVCGYDGPRSRRLWQTRHQWCTHSIRANISAVLRYLPACSATIEYARDVAGLKQATAPNRSANRTA